MDRIFKPGEIIISKGDIGNSAYIIQSGKVEVFVTKENEHITLGTLGKGHIFGEMAIIDECPRSASVKAIDDVKVREIEKEEFNTLLRVDPTILIPIIKSLFERLRITNRNITSGNNTISEITSSIIGKRVFMKGIGKHAIESLENKTIEITKFPFKVGRKVGNISDPLTDNDFYLEDNEPYNVSRNHFAIHVVENKNKTIIIDRGSTLGTIVNGISIGGHNIAKESELKDGDNEVIVGSYDSQFKFMISVINK